MERGREREGDALCVATGGLQKGLRKRDFNAGGRERDGDVRKSEMMISPTGEDLCL